LKKAVKLIEEDGNYFQELKKACEDKIMKINPKAVKPDFGKIN
jgi:hypothetical protein